MAVRDSEDFFKQDLETTLELLSRDDLKISTEVEVLRAVLGLYSSKNELQGRYDKIYQLMQCVRFCDMSQKQLMECEQTVKAVGDIVLLYAYRSIVPRLMEEQLQDSINVSSTGPRTCSSVQSELAPLLNILSSQDDATSDVSEFEDVEEEAKVHTEEERDPLQESMDILQEKMDILNARVWDNSEELSVAEYKELALKRDDLKMDAAREAKNNDKNRYHDILPYDCNRVQLEDCCSDYINASYIHLTWSEGLELYVPGRRDAFSNYIATQGPLRKTSHCFWSMVWQEKAQRILMLTSEIECRVIKCHRYWPGYQETSTYGNIQVTCTKEVNLSSSLVKRKFKLKNLKTEKERSITQYQYHGWPELAGPNDTGDFIDVLSMIRRKTKGCEKPMVVHCGGGVGRTGVFITLDTAWSLMEAEEPVYPLEIIRELRSHRACCVQTVHQYEFICNAVLKVYKEKFDPSTPKAEKRPSLWKRMVKGFRKMVCCCLGGEEVHPTTE